MTFIEISTLIQTISLVLNHIFHQTNVNYFCSSLLCIQNLLSNWWQLFNFTD